MNNNLIGYFYSSSDNKEYKIYSENNNSQSVIECLKNNNFSTEKIVSYWQRIKKRRVIVFNPIKAVIEYWNRLLLLQKICVPIIIIMIIVALIAVINLSIRNEETMFSIFPVPISNVDILEKIRERFNEENVKVKITRDGKILVKDDDTARKMRVILINYNLVPSTFSPWEIFDKERWTLTDYERNINKQRAQQIMIEEHLKAINGIDNVVLNIKWNKERLFDKDKDWSFVSLIITPKHSTNIFENTLIMNGIKTILKNAVPNLTDENILILDNRGNVFDNSN